MKIRLSLLSLLFMLCACQEKPAIIPFFPLTQKVTEKASCIHKDHLANIESIESNDSLLIVTDYYDGYIFTMFDVRTGICLGRFGAIGQGPNELLNGCDGILNGNKFTLFLEETGFIAAYHLDSLFQDIQVPYGDKFYYDIPEGYFSKVISLQHDSLYLGAGVYKEQFQYCLFNTANVVIDSCKNIYNINDVQMNKYHKFLSNQGVLKKKNNESTFVYALYASSRIDFISISNKDHIEILKSHNLKNPTYDIWNDGNLNHVIPNNRSIIGYLDLSTSSQYVYALFSDKKVMDENRMQNPNSSQTVLVYDWKGNPVGIIELPYPVYHISVNEVRQEIYGSYMDAEKNWRIGFFSLKDFK